MKKLILIMLAFGLSADTSGSDDLQAEIIAVAKKTGKHFLKIASKNKDVCAVIAISLISVCYCSLSINTEAQKASRGAALLLLTVSTLKSDTAKTINIFISNGGTVDDIKNTVFTSAMVKKKVLDQIRKAR